ncbi:MAG: hypothetical protein OEX19_03825, partial [Gammaproteobacteria bacterium]|nr:hypothetical protein [Gammaproteobacteria bacterium]
PEEKKPGVPVVVPKLLPVRGESIKLLFFGNELVFPYDKKMIKRMHTKIDKDAISSHWSLLARSDYEPLLKQLDSVNQNLSLNDWAYAVLVHKLAGALYPGQENEQVLFSWFILIKSAYRSRLAYENNRVYLLMPIKQQVYAAQSLLYKNQKYYVLGFDGGKQPKINSVFTYDSEYQGSDRLFDLQLPRMIATGNEDFRREFAFNYSKKRYQIITVNNKYIVDFMRTYPQVHWDVYFNSNPVNPTRQQLADQLRPVLNELNEVDAVNLLLRFVQTAFKYDTDDRQFGYENPLFLEETLFYPASDCEDRSFLFSWLVKELLGLEVVGLLYPGHMATAVHVNMDVKGDSVRYQGKTYFVADPTYTNADIGMAMPKFQSKKPEFIRVSNITTVPLAKKENETNLPL